jgi:hypothetical protein
LNPPQGGLVCLNKLLVRTTTTTTDYTNPSSVYILLCFCLRESKKQNNMMTDDDISVSTANNLDQLNPKERAAATKAKQQKPRQLAQTGARLVLCSKSLVVLVLIVSAAVLGYLTWRVMNAEETEDFHAQFSYDAKEIIDTANVHSESLVSVAESFAGLYTSSSRSQGAAWPNFTLPVRTNCIYQIQVVKE